MKVTYILSVLAATGLGAFAATDGSFDILAMNVAGLPAIFNGNDVPGDKATNARTIGSKFSQYAYDIIHVQEVESTGSRVIKRIYSNTDWSSPPGL